MFNKNKMPSHRGQKSKKVHGGGTNHTIRKGFSLMELVIVIAILAILAAVLAPSMFRNVEQTRATKDQHAMTEVEAAIMKSMATTEGYDELNMYALTDNVSCYIDQPSESVYDRQVIRVNADKTVHYSFDDDARLLDETNYYAAGRMLGLTITFEPTDVTGNNSKYIIKNGVINKFIKDDVTKLRLEELEYVCNYVESVVGETITMESQTYRNSEYTIFIRFGVADEFNGFNAESTKIYGQYNGTNLSKYDATPTKVNDRDLTPPIQPIKPPTGIKPDPTVPDDDNPEDEPNNGLVYTQGHLSRDALASMVTSKGPKSIVFVTTGREEGTDLSEEKNKSVLGWMDGTTLYISNANPSYKVEIKSFEHLFSSDKSENYKYVEHIDVSNLNSNTSTTMANMFYCVGCATTQPVKIVGLQYFDTSKITNMSYIFNSVGMNSSSVNIQGIDNWNVFNVKSFKAAFSYAGKNAQTLGIDLTNWNPANAITTEDMFSYTLYNANKFYIGNLNNWNVKNVTSARRMFQAAGYESNEWSIGTLKNWRFSQLLYSHGMFERAAYKTPQVRIDASDWGMDKLRDASYMFCNFGNEASVWSVGDLSKWNMSNCTNIARMFHWVGINASNWSIGDISGWDTSKIQNMEGVFSHAGLRAKEVSLGNLGKWNTSQCTNMSSLFSFFGGYSDSVYIGDLSNWDTSKVTNMKEMFWQTAFSSKEFNIGDIGRWNVSNVTDMHRMFYCFAFKTKSLNIGDIKTWNTSKVTDMYQMFFNFANSCEYPLNLKNWNVSKVVDHTDFAIHAENHITQPQWKN